MVDHKCFVSQLAVKQLGFAEWRHASNIINTLNRQQKSKIKRKKLHHSKKYVLQKFECKKIIFIFELNMLMN